VEVSELIDAYVVTEQLSGRDVKYIDNELGKRYVFMRPYISNAAKIDYIALYTDKVVFFIEEYLSYYAKEFFDRMGYKYETWKKESMTKRGTHISSVRFTIKFEESEKIVEFDKNLRDTIIEIENMYKQCFNYLKNQ
jgi:hypothetical protein